MNAKNMRWGIVVSIVALVLAACLLPPVSRPKARATRIQSVNHLWSVSFTLPVTNDLPAGTNGK
ncbi:MAG TPA: hypothetical protein VFE51_23960 [Verrucomicrobiae bacterium]|nr:hypothetical protein [Verrucomicrobiae bacterium]